MRKHFSKGMNIRPARALSQWGLERKTDRQIDACAPHVQTWRTTRSVEEWYTLAHALTETGANRMR